MPSNSQLTKLGDRLRRNEITDNDLKALDEFRQTFSDIERQAFSIIEEAIEQYDNLLVTKRNRKTQQSIVDKLHRQSSIRLPQMQDIVGCRIEIQSGTTEAKKISDVLTAAFKKHQWKIQIKDRHVFGYRAIHIIVKLNQMFYEIQVRTFAQNYWANLVESASDKKNTLKYGGSEQEQPLIKKLYLLSEQLSRIDDNAHTLSFKEYSKNIEEVVRRVLSH